MYKDTEADDFEGLPQHEDWSKAHKGRDGEDEVKDGIRKGIWDLHSI